MTGQLTDMSTVVQRGIRILYLSCLRTLQGHERDGRELLERLAGKCFIEVLLDMLSLPPSKTQRDASHSMKERAKLCQ